MDPYFRDPITQLGLTVQGHSRLVEELGKLCPKWLAFGGGGYDLGAVARGWALDYGVMLEEQWPNEIPQDYQERYGLKLLRDPEGPSLDSGVLAKAREVAEERCERGGEPHIPGPRLVGGLRLSLLPEVRLSGCRPLPYPAWESGL
ncbi:Probable histone deacetylase 1-B [Geodia barretti]|uniref:Probable histone deacetylase 1-B n=1 Tax=Geodia barretti TaxID=519541 RepID=A0AA35WDG0_GEOBA|nr:Probable histone deacetylase 1-B [Geodia barretti]